MYRKRNGVLNKDFYRDKALNGYHYCGFWDGFHHYMKEVRSCAYKHIKLKESDFENDNYKIMMEKDLTWTKK